MSCEKEEQVSIEETDDLISNSSSDNEGVFKEEIVITDESGLNFASYVIYSDDKDLLSEFLEVNDFSLLINEDDIEILNSTKLFENEQSKFNSDDFELDQEPKIIVELITTNLQEDVKTYSLDIKQNNSKSTNFIFGSPIGYTTKKNFIGVVHYGWGYEFVVKLRYKSKWYKSWKYYTKNGANAWFVYPSSSDRASLSMSSYKLGLTLYPHKYQRTKNYRITYSASNF